MAELSTILWTIQLLLLFGGEASEDDILLKELKSATYECSLDIDDIWKLHCESENINKGAKYFTAVLEGNFENVDPLTFTEMLNSSSISKSEIFCCEIFLKPIIRVEPLSMKDYCSNFSKYSKLLIDKLKGSYLKTLRVNHLSKFEYLVDILKECSALKEIRVFNSSLSEFPVIPIPVIQNNSISALTLTHNEIMRITNGSFKEFSTLKSLDLSQNYMSHLNKSSFDGLINISLLDLSFNRIEIIPSDTFSGMILLENIYLQNNNLKLLNEGMFQRNKLLTVIDISNNELKTLPLKIFYPLTHLTNISCSNCSLISVDEDIFKNSFKLEYLILSHNHIQVIPDKIFKEQKLLVRVNLGFNSIEEIGISIFQHHYYLRYLNLTKNKISSLKKGTFDGAPYIYSLDLSKNKIEILIDNDIEMFYDLEHFDLRLNKIKMVQLGTAGNVFIRKLFLSDNLISKLDITWKKLIFLEILDMDNNQLTDIDLPPCILSVKQTITVSLKNNNISKVNLDYLLLDERKVKDDPTTMTGCFFNGGAKNFVDLEHNPLLCDCNLYPFYNYIKGKVPRKYQLELFLNQDNLTCASPLYLSNKTLLQLEEDAFSCPFTKGCPVPCTCGIRGKDNITLLNCSGHSLYSAPRSIPDGTTVLYFNKNNLFSMKCFNLNTWENLIEMHVDYNSLETLNDWMYPESLRYLSVRGNKLKSLPLTLMHFISSQNSFQLYFGDNDKNCSCDRENLKLFLKENKKFIEDANKIVCKVKNNGTTEYLPLISVPDRELCPVNSGELNHNQKRMIISLCLIFTFLIIALLIYYNHRRLILSFIYIHCDFIYRLCYREDEHDEDKIFDAFVAYSSSDRDIVMDLLQELEDQPPFFKLCIHERNWLPGRFICDNILSSVQSSKRTIIILSNTFINSPWFTLELQAAVSKMSKDKISRIIFILTDKTVSLSIVDPQLRHVISKRTYLVWRERWFWEKLRYALPRKNPVLDNETMIYRLRKLSGVPLILQPE